MRLVRAISLIGALLFGGGYFAAGSAANIFIGSAASGTGDGSSCANQKAFGFFNNSSNWGSGATQIGPDTIVHICGTITASSGASGFLTFQAGGASGHPVTLRFEPGAILQAPFWGSSGAILSDGNDNITIDGGTNGTIQATANGTGLANKQGGTGVMVNNSTNPTIKNLTIANIYVHKSLSDEQGDSTLGISLDSTTNAVVTHNTIHDADLCIQDAYGPSDSNLIISNNTLSNCSGDIVVGESNSSCALTGVSIHDNEFAGGWSVWDDNNDNFHHDGIHTFAVAPGDQIKGTYLIYNNYEHGDVGIHDTALIFIEQSGGGTQGLMDIFNNVLFSSSTDPNHAGGDGLIFMSGTKGNIYNNTLVSSQNSSSLGVEFSVSGSTFENNVVSTVGTAVDLDTVGVTLTANTNDYFNLNPSGNAFFSQGGFQGDLFTWEDVCGCDFGSSPGDPILTANFMLQAKSAAIQLGTNLTFLGIAQLDSDKAGNPRPGSASGNWDSGAFQFLDFKLTPSMNNVIVPAGPNGGSFTVTVGAINGFNETVTMSCAVTGATCTVQNPRVVTPPATVTINVSSTTVGDFPITVTGMGADGMSHSVLVTLDVWTMEAPGNTALSIFSSTQSGTSTAAMFQVMASPQISGTVSLSCPTAPFNACSFVPISIQLPNDDASESVMVTVPKGTAAGNYQVPIQATLGAEHVTQNLNLTVLDFSLGSVSGLNAIQGNATNVVSIPVTVIPGPPSTIGLSVELSCAASLAGSSCFVSPAAVSVSPGAAPTLASMFVTTPSASAAGSPYSVTISATGGFLPFPASPSSVSHTGNATLTVSAGTSTTDLSVAVSPAQGTPAIEIPGSILTFHSVATNGGASAITPTLTLGFPVDVIFPSPGGCTVLGATISCPLPSTPAGSQSSADVQVIAPFTRSLQATAAISSSAANTSTNGTSTSAAVPIRPRPLARQGLVPKKP